TTSSHTKKQKPRKIFKGLINELSRFDSANLKDMYTAEHHAKAFERKFLMYGISMEGCGPLFLETLTQEGDKLWCDQFMDQHPDYKMSDPHFFCRIMTTSIKLILIGVAKIYYIRDMFTS